MFKLLLEIFSNIDSWGKKGSRLAMAFASIAMVFLFLSMLKLVGIV